ncbi:MAG: hypothetical protein WC423_00410 [Vulcanimicrobiota bacterium]
MRHQNGHSLLETLVATGVFVMIAVALSGVWVMYGRAMAMSGEFTAANHLARGVNEGLIANGFDWLKSQVESGAVPVEEDYVVLRRVRGNSADIRFNIVYDLVLNTDATPGDGDTNDRPLIPQASEDICWISVTVRWHSTTGSEIIEDGKYNNSVRYSTFVYRDAMR